MGNDCTLQADATDCKTTNQGVCLQAFFSFKFKSSGLCYELGLNICTGDVSWLLCGPFVPGDWNDVKFFCSTLKLCLEENERVEADDGYIGEDPCVTKCPGGVSFMEGKDWHMKQSEVRNQGETVNHWLKMFRVLQETFQHDIKMCTMCFQACAVFV